MSKPTETQVAAPVVAWLQESGWDVFQEVQTKYGARADIVAVCGRIVWVVEAKTSLSLQLLDQVAKWRHHANYISIAIPDGTQKHNAFVAKYLRDLGIGMFAVHVGGANKWDEPRAQDFYDPRLDRSADTSRLLSALHESQKTVLAAGSKAGGYSTPFKRTCEALVRFLRENPGATLKQAVDGIGHHYHTSQSARTSLSHWIRLGKIPGVAWDGRRLVLSEGAAQ